MSNKLYKLKHKPTGLYYQPHKHRGSNLSERGKVYQTSTHGLSSAFKDVERVFIVYCEKGSRIHKKTLNSLAWTDYSYHQVRANTLVKDWEIEHIL